MLPTAFERILDALRGNGCEYKTTSKPNVVKSQCPAHTSKTTNSWPLTVTGSDQKTLIHCHAGCDNEDVLAALDMTLADLFDDHNGAVYNYPDGRKVHRTATKKFWQSGNKTGRALYRQDALDGATTVFVTEGEKDADAIRAIGGFAVSSAGGAGNGHKADWFALEGMNVIIVADKDDAGKKHALQVVDLVTAARAKSVCVVEALEGKDAADHVAAGHGLDKFVDAPWWTPPGTDDYESDEDSPYEGVLAGMRDGEWLDQEEFEPLRYAVPYVIPEGLSFLVGPPKLGKSWMVAQIGLGIASGTTVFGSVKVDARPVLYLALEDGHRRLQSRFRKILGQGRRIPKWMHHITKAKPDEVIPMILAFLALHPGQQPVIFLDTFGKVKPPKKASQESYQADYDIVGKLKDAIDSVPGATLVIVHHTRKMGSDDFIDSVSGTQGVAGAADCVLILKRKRLSTDAVLAVTGRDVPEAEYAMVIEDGVLWKLDGIDLDAAAAAARSKSEKQADAKLGEHALTILAFVNSRPTTMVDEAFQMVKAGLEDLSADDIVKLRDAVGQTLRRLAETDRIIKLGRGLYRGHTSPRTSGEGSEGFEGSPGHGHESAVPGEGLGEGFTDGGEGKPSPPHPKPSKPSDSHEYIHAPDLGNLQNLHFLHQPSDADVMVSPDDGPNGQAQQTHSPSTDASREAYRNGLCRDCGKAPYSPGRPRCEQCHRIHMNVIAGYER